MHIEAHLISGMMLGIEFVDAYSDEDMEEVKVLVLDIFIVRLMIFW